MSLTTTSSFKRWCIIFEERLRFLGDPYKYFIFENLDLLLNKILFIAKHNFLLDLNFDCRKLLWEF